VSPPEQAGESLHHATIVNKKIGFDAICRLELRVFARLGQEESAAAGCSKMPSSKAVASEETEAYASVR